MVYTVRLIWSSYKEELYFRCLNWIKWVRLERVLETATLQNSKSYFRCLYLPIMVRLYRKLLVAVFRKSTLHRYRPWSCRLMSSTERKAGSALVRKYALLPNTSEAESWSAVLSDFPRTSSLLKMRKKNRHEPQRRYKFWYSYF